MMLGEADLEGWAGAWGVEADRDGDREPLQAGDQEPVDPSHTGPYDRVRVVLGRARDPGAATHIQEAGAQDVSAAEMLVHVCAAPLQVLIQSGSDHQAVPSGVSSPTARFEYAPVMTGTVSGRHAFHDRLGRFRSTDVDAPEGTPDT